MPVMRSQKEIRQRAPLWLLVLLVLNFALISYDAHVNGDHTQPLLVRSWGQAVLAPFQRATTGGVGAGIGVFRYIADFSRAAGENESLRRRVADLERETRATRAANDENDRLKGLLGLQEQSAYKTVPAHVVARDPSDWFDTVIIDRGHSSGVELSMPVVTQDGIVGRVVALSRWTAQVMLVTDERAAAGAVVGQLGASNALGSIRGAGKNGLLEMHYVSGLEPVKVGDYVVTTGQDGIYPRGLNVGEVVDLKPGTATTSHEIKIKPSARLSSLEEVAVLLYRAPARVAPDQALPNVDKRK